MVEWFRAPEGGPGGWIYPDGEPDLFAALGAGGNRMYILPSRGMVVVRLGHVEEVRRADAWQDAVFLGHLLTGKAPDLLPQMQTTGHMGPQSDHGGDGAGRQLGRLDRNADGRISREEAGGRRWFDRADADGDGFVTLEEAQRLGGGR